MLEKIRGAIDFSKSFVFKFIHPEGNCQYGRVRDVDWRDRQTVTVIDVNLRRAEESTLKKRPKCDKCGIEYLYDNYEEYDMH